MALLMDKRAQYTLTLDSILPSPDGLRNAYTVAVRDKDEVLFDRQYTTYAGTPDGHWYVWRLFRGFQLAERMATQDSRLNITGRGDELWNEPATLSVDAGWLRAVLWADTLTHTRPEPRIQVGVA